MIKGITVLDDKQQQQLVSLLEQHRQDLTSDHSTYARGRQKLWLQHEWNLKDRSFKPAIQDKELWDICKQWMPDADMALAAYGSVGIKPHRDDSYADYRSVGINLGDIESWYYDGGDPESPLSDNYGNDGRYPEYQWTREQLKSKPRNYRLKAGTVFEFNCKNPHGCNDPSPDRWGIFLWRVNKKFRGLL